MKFYIFLLEETDSINSIFNFPDIALSENWITTFFLSFSFNLSTKTLEYEDEHD